MNYPNFAYIAIRDLHILVLTNEMYEAEYFLRRHSSENFRALYGTRNYITVLTKPINRPKPKLYESKTTSLNSATSRFTLISSYNLSEVFCNIFCQPSFTFTFLSPLCPTCSPNFNHSPINVTGYWVYDVRYHGTIISEKTLTFPRSEDGEGKCL
jgi:hypothetical protein